jgi:fructokinase
MGAVIVTVGEALIDLIEEDGALRPLAGGGPFNSAVALGRLEVPVGFLGRLSHDRFGSLLAARLAESGVDLRYVLYGPAPTTLAVVQKTEDGGHEFVFYLEGTSYADLPAGDLPELGPEVLALCAGTLALATDPPAGTIEVLLERESRRRLVVIDPNVRPAVFGDRDDYRRRFERWAGFAHVIKLSDADAAWLYPDEPAEAVLDGILAHGVRLAVVTRGADGALAKSARARAEVASPAVEVVDTVGAGDAFTAGLLRWLWSNGRLDAEAIDDLASEELEDALRLAAAVGALQCSRAGATPPTLAELDSFTRERMPEAGRPLR